MFRGLLHDTDGLTNMTTDTAWYIQALKRERLDKEFDVETSTAPNEQHGKKRERGAKPHNLKDLNDLKDEKKLKRTVSIKTGLSDLVDGDAAGALCK